MDSAQIRTQTKGRGAVDGGPEHCEEVLGIGTATSTARANIFVDFISKSHYQMVSLWVPSNTMCVCVCPTYLSTQTHTHTHAAI